MHSKFEDFTDEATIFFERSYDINGYSYLVLFGHHVNGGYVVIMNHNIACEVAVNLDSKADNAAALEKAGLQSDTAAAIAAEIERYIVENEHIIQLAINKSRAAMFKRLSNAGLKPIYRTGVRT